MTKIETAAKKVVSNEVLTAGARVAMVLGVPLLLYVLTTYINSITALANKVQALETQQAVMFSSQGSANGRWADEVGKLSTAVERLGQTIAPLSQITERLLQLDRRVSATEIRNDAQEERLGRLGESVVEMRTNLESLIRASAATLPGAPGVRAR